VLGFFLDCLTSAIFGLYMFLYVLIFYLSNIVGGKIYAGKPALIASFTALCTLLEGLVIVLFYRFVFGADILDAIPKIFVPQAAVVGSLSPLCFILLQRLEVFLHVEDRRPAQRI
jgi:cell shape-determining protein MreD